VLTTERPVFRISTGSSAALTSGSTKAIYYSLTRRHTYAKPWPTCKKPPEIVLTTEKPVLRISVGSSSAPPQKSAQAMYYSLMRRHSYAESLLASKLCLAPIRTIERPALRIRSRRERAPSQDAHRRLGILQSWKTKKGMQPLSLISCRR